MCNNILVKSFSDLKVAIIHDQLTQYGGAERTLEQLLDIFPEADIFTGYSKPINISEKILKQKIISGLGGKPIWVQKVFNYMSFLMPFVFEAFDLRNYDVIISEGTAWPKGVLTTPEQLHISYVYTPPRFLYGYATEGQKRDNWLYKPFLVIIDHLLRLWDFSAAQRPDYILSISQEVAKRVKKFYRRESTIIYPPVDVNEVASSPPYPRASQADPYGSRQQPQDSKMASEEYYLCISRLAAYKNVDLLINAFNKTHLKLIIAGTGKEEAKLKSLAKANITMLGFVTDAQKNELLENCKGFIFPTNLEDFGITVVEALAHGKPVLSHKSGGPLEIIDESVTGMFFNELDADNLAEQIVEFDKNIDAGLY